MVVIEGNAAMSISDRLKEIATETLREMQERTLALEPERLRIELRLREIEVTNHAARLAAQRLANLPIQCRTDYQCPRCWIESETRARLRPIQGSGRVDLFRCENCVHEFSFPF